MKTVVVVGAGALGSHLVSLLRNVDATIHVVDFDRVEQKNTASQFFGKPSVGKSKVVALQQLMNYLWGLKVDATPHRLEENNANEILGKAELILDCLDNGASRRVVQRYVRCHGIPCLHGALAADGGYGRVVWDDLFEIDDETPGVATCEDGEHLPFIAITAAYMAHAAKAFLTSGVSLGFQISPTGGAMAI